MNIFRSLTRFALPLMLMLVSTAAWADNITLYSSYSIEARAKRQLTAYVPLSPGAFTLRLNGSNFVNGVVVKFGGVELVSMVSSATSLTATGMATAAQLSTNVALTVRQVGVGATTSETVLISVVAGSNPPPPPTPPPTPTPPPGPVDPGTGTGTADLAAGRFLEQAAFGPNPAALARVKLIGNNAWLTEQFSMPETAISNPVNDNRIVQSQLLNRLATAPDQLRQKVAYGLSEFIVISMNKNNYAEQTAPDLQTLSRNAFGNYRTLMGEIAISSQMGKYLDLANSNKPSSSGGANENFPRELMQLFTLGLVKLNLDGSNQLNALGQTLPVYDQSTVQQVALAMTGWTYIGNGNNNWENFAGPMVPRDANHDMRAKSFLGCNLPAGQGAQADMNAALDCIFTHPNVSPFISVRLIRSLVKSNPTPAYVQRVAGVFNNNGGGVRGDLKAVVRAILLDTEARNDTIDASSATSATSGRLKDPVYHVISMLRSLGGSISATNQAAWSFSRTGQTPLSPPSVFSYYSPMFRAPHTGLYAPEFQIYTPTEAVLRGNFIWQILSSPGSDFPLDLSRFVGLGGNIPGLINAVDQTLMYGRMPAALRQNIANAVAVQQDNQSRAWTALYLALRSGQHAVQY